MPWVFRASSLSSRCCFNLNNSVSPLQISIQRSFTQSRRMAAILPRHPIFEAIATHNPNSPAIIHSPSGRTFTYGNLAHDVAKAITDLQNSAQNKSLTGERIAFLVENGYDYVVTLLSIFANNAIAIPLSTTFPNHELRYFVDHSKALMLLASSKFHDKALEVVDHPDTLHKPIVAVEKILAGNVSSDRIELVSMETDADKGGLMLYTSGTTNRPKGVFLPQSALTAQVHSLLEAWKYDKHDRSLHVLPMHHIHGVVNALLTPLFAGASVEFLFPFNANAVWSRFAAPFSVATEKSATADSLNTPITFFTAVPTIYTRLISEFSILSEEQQAAVKTATLTKNLRVNISGSAALPTPVKSKWTEITGDNVLLERYGMTEIGMALSCGLDMEERIDGAVGWPLPGVEVRLVDVETGEVIDSDQDVDANGKERLGEIQVRAVTVFKEYWQNEKATEEEFVEATDGKGRWFKTGDVAIRKTIDKLGQDQLKWNKGPVYFIQGRKSADIIKTGGEKVSALEVEREMLSLSQVSEVAVVGLPSEKWGQKVVAVVVLSEFGQTAGKEGKTWSPLDMRKSLKEKLANYKIPQGLKVVESIPRNAMGKINKKELVQTLFPN